MLKLLCDFMEDVLKELYLEFISFDKNSIDYKRYSYFFGLYFNSHKIPSSIIDIYNKNYKGGNIEDTFICNIDNIIDRKKEASDKRIIKRLNNEIREINEKLFILKELKNRTNELLSIMIDNNKININIKDYKKELRSTRLRDRKNIKSKIDELENLLIDVDINYEIDLLYEYYTKVYVSKYKDDIDFTSLSILNDSLEDKINELRQKLSEKKSKLKDKKNHNINYEIDISDLYDRLGG